MSLKDRIRNNKITFVLGISPTLTYTTASRWASAKFKLRHDRSEFNLLLLLEKLIVGMENFLFSFWSVSPLFPYKLVAWCSRELVSSACVRVGVKKKQLTEKISSRYESNGQLKLRLGFTCVDLCCCINLETAKILPRILAKNHSSKEKSKEKQSLGKVQPENEGKNLHTARQSRGKKIRGEPAESV